MSALLGRIVPGLAQLPARLAAAVDAEARVIERAAGEPLFEDGSQCAGMFVVERGSVRVCLTSECGRSLVLYRVHAGETCVLRLNCLLGPGRYGARCEAETDVRGVSLPSELFDRLVQELPAFRDLVIAGLADRLRGALSIACVLAFESLDQRLAATLLERVEREASLDIAVTHQQLADELGCTREAASRLLESLKATGALALGRGRVHVVDRPLLLKHRSGAD